MVNLATTTKQGKPLLMLKTLLPNGKIRYRYPHGMSPSYAGARQVLVTQSQGICSQCGRKVAHPDVHHRNGHGYASHNPDNNLNNLIVLCRSCHRIEHLKSCNSAETHKNVLELRIQGLTYRQIRKELSISIEYARVICKRYYIDHVRFARM